MVVQCTLGFNLLLDRDYVHDIRALVSLLFHMMCFSHEGRIVTIDQLSFIGPNFTPNQLASINGPYMQMVISPPQINYVATYSMPASTDDLAGDVVHHLLGALESHLSIGSFETFQRIILPSNENLLEAMASSRS